jgi:hypothetical protein
MDRGPGRARSPILKGLQYQQSFALKFAFILLNSQIGTMTAQGDVAPAAKPAITDFS